MQAISPKRIPNYVRARSPLGLRRAMLLNNAKRNTFYEYFDISQDIKGDWYAWFMMDIGAEDVALLDDPKHSESKEQV